MLSRNRLQSAYAAPDFDANARLNAELPALEKTRRKLEQIRTVAQDRGEDRTGVLSTPSSSTSNANRCSRIYIR